MFGYILRLRPPFPPPQPPAAGQLAQPLLHTHLQVVVAHSSPLIPPAAAARI